jgi:hypothetical protein
MKILEAKHSLEMYENIPKAQLCIMPIITFRASIDPKLFNEIVNRFYQNHLQDQIQTLQSGKISVAYSRDFGRSTNNEIRVERTSIDLRA